MSQSLSRLPKLPSAHFTSLMLVAQNVTSWSVMRNYGSTLINNMEQIPAAFRWL